MNRGITNLVAILIVEVLLENELAVTRDNDAVKLRSVRHIVLGASRPEPVGRPRRSSS